MHLVKLLHFILASDTPDLRKLFIFSCCLLLIYEGLQNVNKKMSSQKDDILKADLQYMQKELEERANQILDYTTSDGRWCLCQQSKVSTAKWCS